MPCMLRPLQYVIEQTLFKLTFTEYVLHAYSCSSHNDKDILSHKGSLLGILIPVSHTPMPPTTP